MRKSTRFSVALSVLLLAASAASVAGDESARDATLSARVKTALTSDTAIESRAIEVKTKDGIVQLSGFVSSEEQRTAALLRARAVPGVTEVRNDLSIRDDDRPAARPVADTVIAAKVRDTLRAAELGDGNDVNVEVSKGVVQLSGFVSSARQKARAGDLASAVEGVRDVENQIALTDEQEPLRE